MELQIGDKAKVIKNGNENFSIHFLEMGSEVEIVGFYNGWKNKKAYYVKGYGEPLLQEELEKIP